MKQYEKHGFTLVELLVVIVIIGMLMAMLIPAINAARARARQAECANNQKQLGTAITTYQTQKQHFPGFCDVIGFSSNNAIVGSWPVTLLKDLGRGDTMTAWRTGKGFNAENEIQIDLFVCPSDEVQGKRPLSYVANCGYVPNSSLGASPAASFAPAYGAGEYNMVVGQIQKTGIFADRRVSTGRQPTVSVEDIKDGTSTTLMLSERANNGTPGPDAATHQYPYFPAPGHSKAFNKANLGFIWTENDTTVRINISKQLYHISSNHPGVTNATFCDNHQQSLSDEIDGAVYCQLMTPWGQHMSIVGNSDYTQKPLDQAALDQ